LKKGILTFENFRILPIQRVPRYELLLKELIKCTPKEHEDYAQLNGALAIITKVNLVINEGKRKIDFNNRLLQIVNILGGPEKVPQILQPDRHLILEGHIRAIFPGRQNVVHCYIILCSDSLIITRISSDMPYLFTFFKEVKWSDFDFGKPGNFVFREIKKIEGAKIQLVQIKNTSGFEVEFAEGKNQLYRFFPWNNSNYSADDWFKFFSKAIEDIEKRKATRIERQKIIDRKVRETMMLNPSTIQQSFRNISKDLQRTEMKEKRKTIELEIAKFFQNINLNDVHVRQSVLAFINKLIQPSNLPQKPEEKNDDTQNQQNTPQDQSSNDLSAYKEEIILKFYESTLIINSLNDIIKRNKDDILKESFQNLKNWWRELNLIIDDL